MNVGSWEDEKALGTATYGSGVLMELVRKPIPLTLNWIASGLHRSARASQD